MTPLISSIKFLSYISAVPALWAGRHIRGLLWYYAWASFLCDVASAIITGFTRYQGRVIGNLFTLLELLLVGFYFSKAIFSGRTIKIFKGLALALASYYVLSVARRFNEQGWEYNAIVFAFLIVVCVLALYKVIRNIEHLRLESSPLFIFSAAFLLYASYSLMLMLFASHFTDAPLQLKAELWSIHNVLNILKNLTIARVFMQQQKAVSR